MNKPDGQAYAIVGGIALTQLFFGLTMAIYPGWPKVGEWLNNGNAANWAQAIFAGLAIGAGAGAIAWQVRRQAQHESNRAMEEKIRRLETLVFAVFALRLELVYLRATLTKEHDYRKRMPNVESAIQRIASVPLMDIPTIDAISSITTCISAISQLTSQIEGPSPLIHDTYLVDERVDLVNTAYEFVLDNEVILAGNIRNLGAGASFHVVQFENKRYTSGQVGG